MASTNKTTNYELSQFIETDRPGWLTDYNGDMRTIDSTMKSISDVASGASGSITDLANRMTNAEGNIITNANDIDALEARADALEAQAQSSAGAIAGIQTEQVTQNAGIEAATELGYNLARPYDSASTYAVGAYVLFQNTLYKCITAVSTGEAFDPTKWLAIKATDEIASGGTSIQIIDTSITAGTPTIDRGQLLSFDVRESRELVINNTPLLKISVGASISYNYAESYSGYITVPITWGAGAVKPTQTTAYCSYTSFLGDLIIVRAQILHDDQSGDSLRIQYSANTTTATQTPHQISAVFLFMG